MSKEFEIVLNKKPKVDISEWRECLGNLVGSYVFLPGPSYRLREIEAMYSLINGMLVATGKYNRYHKEMENIKKKYDMAVSRYSSLGDDEGWKDTQKLCLECSRELYRIAMIEDLIKVNSSMFVYGGNVEEVVDDEGKVIRR